jgi:hypothetical protein
MAVIFNATTTQGMIVTPDNSGTFQFQSNGANIATLTAAPAFSAYSSSTQTPTSGVNTKVIFGTKSYDTNSNYDPTLSRFTPTVAGYYQMNVSVATAADTSIASSRFWITKNGSGQYAPSVEHTGLTGAGYYTPAFAALVYANGTTDYFEVYGMVEGTGTNRYFFSSSAGLHATVFQGILVRSA